MNSPNGDGPDGSSLKPVSSLRARFENMNMNKPSANTTNKTSDIPNQPLSRPISPAPKPERLRDFKPGQDTTPSAPLTPIVPARPKERPQVATLTLNHNHDAPPPSHHASRSVSAPKSQTAQPPPPAVMVQPPQSPPKGRILSLTSTDQSPFLNPDAVATPTTPGASPRQFKIPSRTHTPSPSLSAPRSPLMGTSRPPSPPPPRRSAELRRERETKPALQTLVPRNDKALIPSLKPTRDSQSQPFIRKGEISEEHSPFSSPPSSPGSGEGTPPKLPTRPRPQNYEPPVRPRSVIGPIGGSKGGFEPPPVHHSIMSMRSHREQDTNTPLKGRITPQITGESRPALPARPQTFDAPPRPPILNNTMGPPPRPPRPGISTALPPVDPTSTPPKRVVSTPTTQQAQQLAPPTRTHGRSMTIDRTSDRAPIEFRTAPAPIAAPITPIPTTTKPIQSVAVVAKIAPKVEAAAHMTTYPDASNTNRRPPYVKQGSFEIATKFDARIFDVCGEFVCASGNLTRVWSLLDGELIMSLSHTEGVRATAVAFKPAANPQDEGKRLWIGTNGGDLMDVEIATHGITTSKPNVHGRVEVTRIYRHYNELWTLDEAGTLLVWGPDQNNLVPNVTGNPTQSYKVPKAHTFSMVVGDELWHATGKEIRIFAPATDGRAQFQVLVRPLIAEGAGEVTSGTLVKSEAGKAFFGHIDGKVSIYSTSDYSCLGVINISTWKINALANAGRYIWAAYNTGKVCVYDIDGSPWILKKEWQAHDNPIVKMIADPASSYFIDRQQVISLGADNKIKAWDGSLQEDCLEDSMKAKDTRYCNFQEIKALFFTWNAGASTPNSLRYSGADSSFFQDLLQSSGSPDIIVFGFQELVDLEDKKATAKRFLKPKKKEGSDQERMSHQYRDWRDFLMKSLDDYMPADDLYHLLHTAPMVGLFTCIFVKASLRERIHNLSGAEVKRGMGGLHGNKGCVAVRFRIDDTSLCFINCHLAAGQSQANARHSDIAAILDAEMFPAERDSAVRVDTYVGGGDGSMVMDHELCVLNGDLNYRIDTMSRDTVVTAVKQNNLSKLLERDQLLVARRRNPAFKLRAFDEMPITFAPTYKYDVGTDTYDTSEKKRSPAWCDRLLHRGRGRVQQLDYKRHEVRVSDHRPVTGRFKFWVKKVDARGRAVAWMESQQGFEDVRQREITEDKMLFLMNTCGFDEAASKQLVKEKSSRRANRSPSRN
ncbi:Fc.00g047840.m01.CDS01 [Cosmosporella sp. VM-42]